MTAPTQSLTARPAWKALEAHHRKARGLPLRGLFVAVASDPIFHLLLSKKWGQAALLGIA